MVSSYAGPCTSDNQTIKSNSEEILTTWPV
jgi:hypothetical protein